MQLTLRYVAHLGLKTFVSSVINNGGYFSVETNKNGNKKERIESKEGVIVDSVEVEGDFGTIFQVVLPVRKRQPPIPAPTRGWDDDLRKGINSNGILLNSLLFDAEEVQVGLFERVTIHDKRDEESFVHKYGEQIINQINKVSASNICIDAAFLDASSPTFIFKLIAYVRLNMQNQHQPKTVVCYNIDDNKFNRLEEISINLTETFSKKNQEVWSEKYITVLISKKLQILSLSGTTKDDFCYINHKLRKHYSNALKNIPLVFSPISNERQEELNKFILHFEIENAIASHIENQVLVHPIEDVTANDIGCVVKIPARLGEKIYIDEFYQADHLFLNGFYATKFAICIARNVIKQFKGLTEKRRVVLLGYHQYSKLLLDYVSKLLTEYTELSPGTNYYVEKIAIGYEERDKDKAVRIK